MWRRCRTAAVIGVFTVGMLAGALLSTATATAQAQAPAPAHARIPWSKVGLGWELVQYTSLATATQLTTTLYLVGPSGAKYALRTSHNGSSTSSRGPETGQGHCSTTTRQAP